MQFQTAALRPCSMLIWLVLGLAGMMLLHGAPARAQGVGLADPFNNARIETVSIRLANPGPDAGLNDRITDSVRRALSFFPGTLFSQDRAAFAIGRALRNPDVADITYDLGFGRAGGLDVQVTVTLATAGQTGTGRGYAITGNPKDFPLIYDRNGTVLRFKLDALGLYYANRNAWYGDPQAMLAGNPLVQGNPAGKAYEGWVEGLVTLGISGITPVTESLYAYGAFSMMTTGSKGQELFTDLTRSYTAVEDAYIGVVGGRTSASGNRLAFNLSAGRQRFTLANALLIANTAANGQERAALQANARWASDLLALGQVSYNTTKLEVFYVDPDELPVIDTDTRIGGINIETTPTPGLMLAGSYLSSPQSGFSYFGPTGSVIGTRQGLETVDLRFTWEAPGNVPGPFFGGEIARQTNRNFSMDARAAYVEAGYTFADAAWTPSVGYRLSYFSGDDPATATYERWDPLLSGGNGEQWVQGSNHFKVVQDSNVIAHRLQARMRPSPKIEIVPQLWAFYADSLNNIGGNPALTFLGDSEYGYEANVTLKWFASRNLYVHGMVAYTVPGEAVDLALEDPGDWFSLMFFLRYAF
ncbi:MAG: alginate export family protein [Cereibacter sp.]